MDPQVVTILDNIGAGTFISIIIAFSILGIGVYKWVTRTKKTIDTISENRVISRQKNEKESKDLETLLNKMTSLENKFDTQTNEIKAYVDEKCDMLDTRVTGNEKNVRKLRNEVMDYKQTTDKILETIHEIDNKIEVLIDSDKETIRTFIMTEYNKWVGEKKEIDLLSLQNIERLYKKYLEELDEDGDEFIEKLIKELRNLPTKR